MFVFWERTIISVLTPLFFVQFFQGYPKFIGSIGECVNERLQFNS